MNLALSHGAAFLLTEAEINPLDLVRQHLKVGGAPTRYQLNENVDIVTTGSHAVTMSASTKVEKPLGSRLPLLTGSTIIVTEGVLESLLTETNRAADPLTYLLRHCEGDWGDVSAEDKRANDSDVVAGGGALSAYYLPDGERVWVNTNYTRQRTTILLPDEY